MDGYINIDEYLRDVISFITPQSTICWLIIAFLVGVFSYYFFHIGKIKLAQCVSLPVMAIYLSFVITITIISREPSIEAQSNVLLLWSYKAILNGQINLIAQVFWNIVMFIPIGTILMMILTCRQKWLISLVIGLLLSTSIEIIQLISHRGLFEFDDILHNTFGTFIGVVAFALVRKIRILLSQ